MRPSFCFLFLCVVGGCAGHAAERRSEPSSGAAARAPARPLAVEPLPIPSPAPMASKVRVSALSKDEIRARLEQDPASLGSLSVGGPSRGSLWNGVAMPQGPLWEVVDPKHSFGTEETVRSLARAIETVSERYPGSPRLFVGQISSEHGGYLRPHRSHQNGRDVDVGYYYQGGPRWYARASAKTLDAPRTWALVGALAADPNVEMLFIDRSVQRILRAHAESMNEDPARLRELFESVGNRQALVRHEWGHTTHMHVRFRCPDAREAAAAAYPALVALGMARP